MKYCSGVLILLFLAAAATAGAGAQQQTFWSAKAAPKLPPPPTAQPIDPDYLYYACVNGRPQAKPASHGHGRRPPRRNPCALRRPEPRHT
jgi:hypothetical protein